MADKTAPAETAEQRFTKLTSDLADAWRQINRMQQCGGFTDAKTHSVRSTRIEQRLEFAETQIEALLDVSAHLVTLLEDHLRDRHDSDVDRDSAIDATSWRKIRRRLREMAEKLGLMDKNRAIKDVRRDENRLRARAQA